MTTELGHGRRVRIKGHGNRQWIVAEQSGNLVTVHSFDAVRIAKTVNRKDVRPV